VPLEADVNRAVERIPRWIAALGLLGTAVAAVMGGISWAAAFLAGAAAAYVNFLLIERAVNRLGRLALAESAKAPKTTGFRMFIRFAFFVLGAFVILRFSGFNIVVALCGFLVCPAAVMLEILYELLIYGHS
jgi:hypothetical protein